MFRTLYLSEELDRADFNTLESALGCEISMVDYDTPAINVYTNDDTVVDDAVYWLRMAGVEVLLVA